MDGFVPAIARAAQHEPIQQTHSVLLSLLFTLQWGAMKTGIAKLELRSLTGVRCDAGEAAMVFNWGWLRRAFCVDISSMTAADQIVELQRQRAEKHRLIDDEYDKRVRMVPHV